MQETLCIDCKSRPRLALSISPRCDECKRKHNAARARVLRAKKRKALLKTNGKLKKKGKRICSKCLKLKILSEFETTLGNGKGILHKICDKCLAAIYNSPTRKALSTEFSENYWRRRAYSCNTTARFRLTRETCKHAVLNDLEFIIKPRHLAEKFKRQKGLCLYCKTKLIPSEVSVDHLIPLSRDGKHVPDNLGICCKDCNRLKFTKTDSEFTRFVKTYAKRFFQAIESTDKEL